MTRCAVTLGLALALIQALAIGRIELTFDEAYYAMWARWPQAGYFDHPPMVAWWIAASQALLGRTEWGVRAPFWLTGLALAPMIYLIGIRLYRDAQVASAAALMFLGAPLVAGAPLATPDTPLVFFWTLALAGLVEVQRGRRWAWALVGLAAGLAGLSKMTAGFLGLGIVLALIATPSLRREWARPGLYGAGALALAVLSPLAWWNATHEWATIFKQGARLGPRAFSPRYLAEFLGAQWLLFNPLSVVALVGVRRSEPARLLGASLAPALGYFLIHSLHDRVQGNWTAPLYPALALLGAGALAPKWRWIAPVSGALGVTLAGAVYLHLATGWPGLGPSDPALRIGGWREVAAHVGAVARARGAGFVLANGYAATSLLSFYGVETGELGEPERWTFRPALDLSGEGLAFGPPEFAPELARRFAQVTPLETVVRRVGGRELESYRLFAVSGVSPAQ